MAIAKKRTTPHPLFSMTFYIALLGFIFGAFSLGITLIVLKPLQDSNDTLSQSIQNAENYTAKLQYCYENDLKPCTQTAIDSHQKSN